MNTTLMLSVAGEINAAHDQAIRHADKAIEFAKQAGDLLLKVKADLPHGEFLPWVEANCTVSPRQAQRYMSAAQGKPIPVRAIASNTTPVSHLPEVKPTANPLEFAPEQIADLANLDKIWQIMDDTIHILIQAGEAMRTIRDKHLYREYPTLEAYCWDRFSMEPDVVADYLSGDWRRMIGDVA